ncbi:phosphatidate cytidylyltransferase [Malaciobacter molluscorum]|uniref:phosphatidate cytidylyltransferase n=1 Tax=Malaciobacter molluscorum TaxID=1032072 RepID=UPI00100C1654|nr:phosphatidate cytidylyltransferase [Malaciobacter molluscorum]RXJ92182.1 phosphatidate cytidylyltransferase [Malaciobacter molluscorum]
MSNLISSSSTRIKTAIALVLVLLIIGYIDSYFVTWLFLGSLLIIAIKESTKLFHIQSTQLFVYSTILWAVAYFYQDPEDLVFILGMIYAAILAYTQNLNKKIFLPLLYPTASFLFLLALYKDFGMQSLLWLLVVVALTDTAAYFVGKGIGKTKFCKTSPNKTLEGVIGGIIFGSLIGSIFALNDLTFIQSLLISFISSVASVFGDLFESYLKREAKVKDSGSFLPGHGGILDRTDGYLFASIIMLIGLRVIA